MAYTGDVKAMLETLESAVSTLETDSASLEAAVAALESDFAFVSGSYYLCNSQTASNTSATLNNNVLRLTQCVIPVPVTVSAFGVEHTVAGDGGSSFRITVYADNSGVPGALKFEGTVSTAGAGAAQEVAAAVTLNPGDWVGGVVQGVTTTQPTMRTVSATALIVPPINLGTGAPSGVTVTGYGQNGVSGSAPDPAGAMTTANAAARVFFKAA